MITGNDEVSVKALAALQNGAKVKELPAIFDISLDQAKRLSRYANMLQTAQDSLYPIYREVTGNRLEISIFGATIQRKRLGWVE